MCLLWQLSTRMCSNMLYWEREKERSEQYCRWVLMNPSSPGHTDTHTQTHSPAETGWHIALITWCIYCLLPMSLSNSWPIMGLHTGACQHLSSTVSEGSGILSKNPSLKFSAYSYADMSVWKRSGTLQRIPFVQKREKWSQVRKIEMRYSGRQTGKCIAKKQRVY